MKCLNECNSCDDKWFYDNTMLNSALKIMNGCNCSDHQKRCDDNKKIDEAIQYLYDNNNCESFIDNAYEFIDLLIEAQILSHELYQIDDNHYVYGCELLSKNELPKGIEVFNKGVNYEKGI